MFDLYLTIGEKRRMCRRAESKCCFLERGRSYVMKAAHLINAVCAYGRRSTLLERFGVEVLWTLRFVYVFQS